MWQLECYRIISSVAGWMPAGEYATPDLALLAVISCGYALDYRIKSPNGDYHAVDWQDYADEQGYEYCRPILGEVVNTWPQHVGNVR